MELWQAEGNSIRSCLTAVREQLGLTLDQAREDYRSGGEDGLYRVYLSNGIVVECTMTPRSSTRVEEVRFMETWRDIDPKGHVPSIEEFLLQQGFYDSTWHNDMCPSFHHEALRLRLWIDYGHDEDREYPGNPRFELHLWDHDDQMEEQLLLSESWDDMEAKIRELTNRPCSCASLPEPPDDNCPLHGGES